MPDAVPQRDQRVLLDPRAPISPDYLWSALCSALPDTRPWMIEHKDALWPTLTDVAALITAEIHRRGLARAIEVRSHFQAQEHGIPLTHWIHETREIPPESVKAVHAATKLVQLSRRPRDQVEWFNRHARVLEPLLRATKWPRRSRGVVRVGPLTVHDTLHLPPATFAASIALIRDAVHAIEAEPEVAKVLYGDVLLSSSLRGGNVMAWYWAHRDIVYLRPQLAFGSGDAHNLIHELGHRYYKRFLSADARTLWALFHMRFGTPRSPVPVAELPPIRDGLVIPNAGFTARSQGGLTVQEADDAVRIAVLVGMDGHGRQVTKDATYAAIRDLMRRQAVAATFPTTYSAESAEEHFCEALALLLTGARSDHPSVNEIRRIVLGR